MTARDTRSSHRRGPVLGAVVIAVLGVLVLGCGSDEPPETALTDAEFSEDWRPRLSTSTTSTSARPETADLGLAVILRNASTDQTLRVGSVTVDDGTGIEVVRAGLEPVAERGEPVIEWPEEPLGVVTSLVLPPQHHGVLRVELRVDCAATLDPDVRFTATDGTTRNELSVDELAAVEAGWVAEVVAQFCAEG